MKIRAGKTKYYSAVSLVEKADNNGNLLFGKDDAVFGSYSLVEISVLLNRQKIERIVVGDNGENVFVSFDRTELSLIVTTISRMVIHALTETELEDMKIPAKYKAVETVYIS